MPNAADSDSRGRDAPTPSHESATQPPRQPDRPRWRIGGPSPFSFPSVHRACRSRFFTFSCFWFAPHLLAALQSQASQHSTYLAKQRKKGSKERFSLVPSFLLPPLIARFRLAMATALSSPAAATALASGQELIRVRTTTNRLVGVSFTEKYLPGFLGFAGGNWGGWVGGWVGRLPGGFGELSPMGLDLDYFMSPPSGLSPLGNVGCYVWDRWGLGGC